jgi:hypothetical protein
MAPLYFLQSIRSQQMSMSTPASSGPTPASASMTRSLAAMTLSHKEAASDGAPYRDPPEGASADLFAVTPRAEMGKPIIGSVALAGFILGIGNKGPTTTVPRLLSQPSGLSVSFTGPGRRTPSTSLTCAALS